MRIFKADRRKTAWILILALLITIIPPGDYNLFASHAIKVGSNTTGDIDVTDVEFVKSHLGFDVSSAVLQIFGENLTDVAVLFEIGGEFKAAGLRSADSNDGFIKYSLSNTEIDGFTGRIRIASSTLRLVAANYPVLQSLDKQIVNKDNGDTLEMSGTSLDRIEAAGVTATYGRGITTKPIDPLAEPPHTPSELTIRPPADSLLGLQDIAIKEVGTTSTGSGSTVDGIRTSVQYTYGSAFRIIKNLTLENPNISPNAASKGEFIAVTATEFPASAGYQVYFLKAGEGYTASNKSPSVVLSGDRTTLTVQVPNNTAISLGTKTVKIIDTLGGEMIAETTAGTFSLIDGTNNPVIDDIAPNSGTDNGSAVSIKGRNLLTPVYPDLVGTPSISEAALSPNKQDMTIEYVSSGLKYQNKEILFATRTVKAIIGATATFQEDAGGLPRYLDGSDDFLYIRTSSISDAATDPVKDVVLEITTTFTTTDLQTYTFDQIAQVKNGYTFIPSSLKPIITAVNPNQIHIGQTRYMKENTLISIEGSSFMVNKWSDADGKLHQNYPVVLIQAVNSLGAEDFVLMFDKNGNPDNLNGRIYYKDAGGITRILMNGTAEVTVDMVVLDASNRVVDGTAGNDVGTRIVMYLPQLAQIDAEAKRHIKIINPKRNSDDLGSETLALDILDFVMEPAAPVIESVTPTIVTAGGGEEVTIIGSTSIQEGARVLIDGKTVTGVTRTIDLTGNKVVLKFKAPAGRLGKTQLAVINPLGGLAVRDFYYVQSFNKDPLITTVAPDKGTEGTLVIVGGDNFFKPDPSVSAEEGMDAFRLIGTRVLLDGVDVNTYNRGSYGEIVFNEYTSSSLNMILQSYEKAPSVWQAQAADYAHSIILKGTSGYYTLETQFDGSIRLTNGQQNSYTLRADGEDSFMADKDGGASVEVIATEDGMTVNGEELQMVTPYQISGNVIIGNRTRVISKNQVAVTIPRMITAGLKDVSVENPDTRRATKADSFFYYDSPYPQPSITSVVPNTGSVSGGYLIAVNGSDFESGSQVFIDGAMVPSADVSVNAAGTVITVKVPKYSRNLADYATDRITVPLVVVNLNAGSASLKNGFTYISPSKEPALTKIQLDTGSTGGGEIVELEGTNFNYYEPFKERDGIPGFSSGDTYTEINGPFDYGSGSVTRWDDLSNLSDGNPPDDLLEAKPFFNDAVHMFYDRYYSSPILPKVYFGTKQAQIVSYGKGRLTVVAPANSSGVMDVYVVNNDTGISNKLKYTYKSSSPKVTYMNPTQGARIGQENRDIYGTGFAQSFIPGYYGPADADLDSPKDQMSNVEALIRFADISNRKIALGQPNDGKIGGGEQAVVSLEGDLSVRYNGSDDTITVNLLENGRIYTGTFKGYEDTKLLIPAGMLKYGAEWYVPNGYGYSSSAYNSSTHYELFLVEVDQSAGRFYVERGYAPRTEFDNSTHINLDTPSYYSVGKVNVSVFNPDGGVALTGYTYRNPASKPTITRIEPQTKIDAEEAWMVEASVKGGITVEIKGHDFREGVKVYIDKKPMEVLDITTDNKDPQNPMEVIIARVPAGALSEIGLRFPVLVENTDGAIANSVDPKTLSSDPKWPIYFIYRNPLSDPAITTVTPAETSIAGGNVILVSGSDFRANCTVIVGSKGGIPVKPDVVDPRGTWLKFTTPKGLLTLGAKDIQVINGDFGTGIKANGLKIISYPEITAVSSELGSELEWLSVEGGGKIKITGSGFDQGARVIFGGSRTEKTETSSATGLTGLSFNDRYFTVTDGILGTVQFVDAGTLIVTAPAVTREKDFTVTVLNGDTGISDGDATVKYSVPVPSAPLNLDAEIVNSKYIKLYGYSSSNYNYFEIYTYIGNKSTAKLKDNDYKDFQYLATAQTEPYKITQLDGLEDMDEDDRVFIVLKAVNKYGPSNWSNIASLRYSKIDDIKGGLGVEDFDGNLDVPAGQAYGAEVAAQQAVVTISAANLRSPATVDMTGTAYALVQNTIVNLPESAVASNYNRITLKMRQGQLGFHPAVLNTAAFQAIARNDQMDTYANLRLEPVTTEYAGMIQRYIPRELKAFSQPYRLGTAASSNAGTIELYDRVGIMDLSLAYQPTLTTGYNPASLKLYWYDSASYRWIPQYSTLDPYNRHISSKASLPGVYIILGPR